MPHKMVWLASVVLLCATPALLLWWLITFYLKSNFSSYFPTSGDAIMYWHEIATLAGVGFHGGHYGFEETASAAARFGVGTFGAHSQWFQLLFAGLSKLTGWGPATGSLLNILLVSLSLGIMAWLMRGCIRFNLFCVAFVGTSLYILLNTPLMMMEGLQYSLAFILAGLFFRWFSRPRETSAWLGPCLWACIMVAALTRYSWGLLYIAYYIPDGRMGSGRAWLPGLAKGIGCALLGCAAYTFCAAPYPYEPFTGSMFGMKVYASLLHGDAAPFVALVKTNVLGMLHPGGATAQYVQFCMILLAFVAAPFLELLGRPGDCGGDRNRARSFALFHVVNLGGVLAAVFFYYYTTLGMLGLRMAMPNFITSFLILVRNVRLRWLLPVLVMQVVLIPSILFGIYPYLGQEYDSYQRDVSRCEVSDLFNLMVYQKDAASPWCNTALFYGGFGYGTALMMVPPAIAINDMRLTGLEGLARPLKSGWIVTDNPLANEKLKQVPGLVCVGSRGDWSVYRNMAARCPQAPGVAAQ
jgi:hypothetical protein